MPCFDAGQFLILILCIRIFLFRAPISCSHPAYSARHRMPRNGTLCSLSSSTLASSSDPSARMRESRAHRPTDRLKADLTPSIVSLYRVCTCSHHLRLQSVRLWHLSLVEDVLSFLFFFGLSLDFMVFLDALSV